MEPLSADSGRCAVINFVAPGSYRTAKLASRTRDDPDLAFHFTETPLVPGYANAYVIDSERMEEILARHRRFGFLPVIPYGPSRTLPRAFALGCCDYLREPWSYEELKVRINRHLTPPVLNYPQAPIRFLPGALLSPFGREELTAEESRVMRLLLAHPCCPVYRESLQLAVWGRTFPGSPSRALDMHISSLRKKIRRAGCLPPAAKPIVAVRGIGYRLTAPHHAPAAPGYPPE